MSENQVGGVLIGFGCLHFSAGGKNDDDELTAQNVRERMREVAR